MASHVTVTVNLTMSARTEWNKCKVKVLPDLQKFEQMASVDEQLCHRFNLKRVLISATVAADKLEYEHVLA